MTEEERAAKLDQLLKESREMKEKHCWLRFRRHSWGPWGPHPMSVPPKTYEIWEDVRECLVCGKTQIRRW
jgi:hypothetical protein